MVSSEVVDAFRPHNLPHRASGDNLVAGRRYGRTTNRTILNSFCLMPIGDCQLRRHEATSPSPDVCQCRLPNQKGRLPAPFLIAWRCQAAQLSCLRESPIASRPLAPGTTFMWMRWPSASSLMPSRASTERWMKTSLLPSTATKPKPFFGSYHLTWPSTSSAGPAGRSKDRGARLPNRAPPPPPPPPPPREGSAVLASTAVISVI